MSMRARYFGVMVAVLLVTPSAMAQPVAPPGDSKGEAKPDATKEAEQHYLRGKQLFDEGDYSLALVEFNRAYEISPNYRVLFNIAQINIQLFNYAAARTTLERFLREGGDDIPAARKTQAEKDLAMLRTRTAHLRISTTPPATVTIDENPMGTAPFTDPLLVNAGQRKVTFSATGYVSATKLVTVAGGETQDVRIVLEAVPVESGGPKVTSTMKKNYTPAIMGWVASGAFAIGAAVFGGIYLIQESTLRDLSNPVGNNVSATARDDQEASATRIAVAADVFGLLAIGAAGVALYFTLKPPVQEAVTVAKIRVTPGGFAGTF